MLVNYEGGEILFGFEILIINGVFVVQLKEYFFKYYIIDGYNKIVNDKVCIENSYGWIFLFEMGNFDIFNIICKIFFFDEIYIIYFLGIDR